MAGIIPSRLRRWDLLRLGGVGAADGLVEAAGGVGEGEAVGDVEEVAL